MHKKRADISENISPENPQTPFPFVKNCAIIVTIRYLSEFYPLGDDGIYPKNIQRDGVIGGISDSANTTYPSWRKSFRRKNMKKTLAWLLTLFMVLTISSVTVFAAETTPAGNNFTGYTRADAIWGEVWGNATESFVIKVLDANDNVMGTTSLNNIDGIIDGDVEVTWSIKLDAASNTDGYWTMEWTTAPSLDNMPAKVQLWVDGVKVSGGNVVLNGPDDINKIVAAVADSNGKILSYATAADMQTAVAVDGAKTILMLRDVTLADVLTLPAGVTLNGNGKTINGTIAADGDLTFAGVTKVTGKSEAKRS